LRGGLRMFNIDGLDTTVKVISLIAGLSSATVGAHNIYSTYFKGGPILEWAPDHFQVSSGPSNGDFDVTIARQKFRDDCSVTGFNIEVKDDRYVIHRAIPSIATWSGPANDKVDKFGYSFTISEEQGEINPGNAMMYAYIDYVCPEGPTRVHYPDHENLEFVIFEADPELDKEQMVANNE